MKLVAGLLSLIVVLPIWYYLLYQILVRVHASELMFFLFWVYMPVYFLVQALIKLSEPK